MAQDINKVIVCGNLTRDLGSDPNGRDFGYTQGGMCIANFSIANNRSRKNQDGTWGSETYYFEIKIFGKTAENLRPYLKKGQKVIVEGILKQERWQGKDGSNQSKVVIYATEIQLVGGKKDDNGQSQSGQYQPQQNPFAQNQSTFAQQYEQQNQPQYQQNGFVQEDLPYPDSDIPF